MLMFNVLKSSWFQNKALKFYSTVLNRNICSCKFNNKKNVDGKLLKLASTLGCGIGIAVFFGISNFRFRQRKDVSEMINNNFTHCEAPFDSGDRNNPESPRNKFNFLADVVKKTQNSVVYIEINARHPYTGEHIPISNGSGFIVKEDGLILTNAHVVNHYGQVTVKLYDGTTFFGVVEDIDTESDLATVRIKAKNLPALNLGSSSDIRPGEFVIAMGNPLTLSHTITAGVVSSANRKGKELGLHRKSDYIQTDATIHVGNSGGPLVNLTTEMLYDQELNKKFQDESICPSILQQTDGDVIGINTMKVTEGISFAIPSDRAIEFLKLSEEKTKSGHWNFFSKPGRPTKHKFLGITMLTLSTSVIKELKERNSDFPSVDHGVLVWRVMIGSPSYEAGIRPGDVITEVNKCKVKSAQTIMDLLQTEDTLLLTVQRGQNTFKVSVPLVEPIMP